MSIIRKSLTLALVCVVAHVYAADRTQLSFGTDPTNAPYESRAADGSLVGFDIDLGNEICKRMNVKCVWVTNDFDGIILALKARKFDAILAQMSITAQRKQEIDFSDRNYYNPSQLIAKKGSGLMPTPQSLAGKAVAVQQGTTQETYAKKYWEPKGVTVSSYGTGDAPFTDLVGGRVDAVLGETIMATDTFLKTKEGSDYALTGPVVKDTAIFGDGCGIGFRKDDVELRGLVNKALADIVEDGTFKKMAEKYFTVDVRAAQ